MLGLALILSPLRAQSGAEEATAPDTVKVGAYVVSVYDLSFDQEEFKADFWLWFDYRGDSLDFEQSVEITNAKDINFSLQSLEPLEGVNWLAEKCRATLKKTWDVRHFPFDKQVLEILLEDAWLDNSQIVYVADTANSSYAPDLDIDGWHIRDYRVEPMDHPYYSNFGNPSISEAYTEYPGVAIRFLIERDAMGIFFKLFTGLYVAFVIAMLVFFIRPSFVDPRFGLSVGALFAAIGNKYIVDSILPQTTEFTLVDQIHAVTFAFIFISIVLSVISLWLETQKESLVYKRVDRIAFLTILGLYIFLNVFLIRHAMLAGGAA